MSSKIHGEANMARYKAPQVSSLTTYEEFPDYTTVPSKCDLCSEVLVGVFRLSKHLARVHKAKIEITCKVCGEKFRRNKAIVQHLRERHMGQQQSVGQDVLEKAPSGDKEREEDLSSAEEPFNIPVANDEDNDAVKSENDESVWDADDFSPPPSPPMEAELEKRTCDTSTSSDRVGIIPDSINKSPVATRASQSSDGTVARSSVKRLATPSCSDGKTSVSNVLSAKQVINSEPRSKINTSSDNYLRRSTVGSSQQAKRGQDLLARQWGKQSAILNKSLDCTNPNDTSSVMPLMSTALESKNIDPNQPDDLPVAVTELSLIPGVFYALQPVTDAQESSEPLLTPQEYVENPLSFHNYNKPANDEANKSSKSRKRKWKQVSSTLQSQSQARANSEAKAWEVSEQTINYHKRAKSDDEPPTPSPLAQSAKKSTSTLKSTNVKMSKRCTSSDVDLTQSTANDTVNTFEDKSTANPSSTCCTRERKQVESTLLSQARSNSEAKAPKVSEQRQTISTKKLKACVASEENSYEDQQPCFEFEKRSIDGEEYQQCIIYRVCKISGGVYNCSVCAESSVTELDAKHHFVQAHSELIQNQCSNSPCVLKFANIHELVSYQERSRGKEILLGLDTSCRKTSAVVNEASSRYKDKEQEDSRLAQDSVDKESASTRKSKVANKRNKITSPDVGLTLPTTSETISSTKYKSAENKPSTSSTRKRNQVSSTLQSQARTDSESKAWEVCEQTISMEKLKACIASVENFYDDDEPGSKFEKRSIGRDEFHRLIMYKVCKIQDGMYYCSVCEITSVTELAAKNHFVQAHSDIFRNRCSNSPCVFKFANILELVSYQQRFRGKEILLGLDTSCRKTSATVNQASSRGKGKEQEDSRLAQDSLDVPGTTNTEENASEPELNDCVSDDDVTSSPAPIEHEDSVLSSDEASFSAFSSSLTTKEKQSCDIPTSSGSIVPRNSKANELEIPPCTAGKASTSKILKAKEVINSGRTPRPTKAKASSNYLTGFKPGGYRLIAPKLASSTSECEKSNAERTDLSGSYNSQEPLPSLLAFTSRVTEPIKPGPIKVVELTKVASPPAAPSSSDGESMPSLKSIEVNKQRDSPLAKAKTFVKAHEKLEKPVSVEVVDLTLSTPAHTEIAIEISKSTSKILEDKEVTQHPEKAKAPPSYLTGFVPGGYRLIALQLVTSTSECVTSNAARTDVPLDHNFPKPYLERKIRTPKILQPKNISDSGYYSAPAKAKTSSADYFTGSKPEVKRSGSLKKALSEVVDHSLVASPTAAPSASESVPSLKSSGAHKKLEKSGSVMVVDLTLSNQITQTEITPEILSSSTKPGEIHGKRKRKQVLSFRSDICISNETNSVHKGSKETSSSESKLFATFSDLSSAGNMLKGDGTLFEFEKRFRTGDENDRLVVYKACKIRGGVYYCSVCDSPFYSEWSIKKHFSSVHNEVFKNRCFGDPYVLIFRSVNAFEWYQKGQEGKEILVWPKFKCYRCDKRFCTFVGWKSHQSKVHNPTLNLSNCKVCGKPVPAYSMQRHVRKTHSESRRIKCVVCSKSFVKGDYWCHVLTVHKHMGVKCKSVKCRICQESTPRPHISKHMIMHYQDTSRATRKLCPHCGKTFTFKASLARHVLSAHSDRPIQNPCSRCLVDFETKELLEAHKLEKHARLCDICDLSCWNGEQFKRHQETHLQREQGRKWQCETCGWSTTVSRGGLTRHKRSHLREKPFQCEFCNFRYNQRRVCNNHVLKVHFGPDGFRANAKEQKENTFECEVCLQAFPNEACLQFHLQYHQEEKQLSCILCSESFHTKYDLLRHKKEAHYVRRPSRMANETDDCGSVAPDSEACKCHVCGRTFPTNAQARRHWREKHRNKEEECVLEGDESLIEFEDCSHTGEETHRFVLYRHSKKIDGLYYCATCERPSMSESSAGRHFARSHKELLENQCSDSPSVLRFPSDKALESYRRNNKRKEFFLHLKFKCDQCERRFCTRHGLKYHKRAGHSEARPVLTKCKVCDKMLNSTSLARHRRDHNRKTELTTCTICNTSFTKNNYWRHMLQAHKNHKPWGRVTVPCSICHKMLTRDYRHTHMINIHGQHGKNKRRVDCQICGENLNVLSLRQHMKNHHDPSRVMELCPQCGRTFTTKLGLRRHVFSAHSGRSIQNSCTTCLLNFETKEQLQEHKLEKHARMCEICGLSARNAQALNRHLQTHLDPEQRRKWQCETCGWTGLTRTGLMVHKRTHLSEKPFQCEFCDFRYNQSQVYITHVFKVHFGPDGFRANAKEQKENTFVCEVCMQAYPNEACLQFHLQYHQEEQQFSCDQCSESFHTKYDLLRHKHGAHYVRRPPRMPTSNNTGDCDSVVPDPDSRGWKCLVCDKKFAIITHARMHWRVKHMNETPFVCKLCGKGYRAPGDLTYHTRAVHTKEAKVVCSLCGKKCYSTSNWRAHMKSHDKNLPCNKCQTVFTSITLYRAHVKSKICN